MTNLEKFEDEIKQIVYCGEKFAVRKCDGEVEECRGMICRDCKFNAENASCSRQRAKWMQEEYEEAKEPKVDWSKVEIDTPILVSNNGEDWYKRYFAEYNSEHNTIFAFDVGATSWSADHITIWRYAKLAEHAVLDEENR